MTAIIIIVLLVMAGIVYGCIRINAPRSKQEAHERFIQDCREFDAYMANKKH